MPDDTPERPGLRERKKERTRADLQRHAFRLFRERGYHETTVEAIADAAEISPRTLFRYFPTKEDLVLYDSFDPVFLEFFMRQDRGTSVVQAWRSALRDSYAEVDPAFIEENFERVRLIIAIPELRMRFMDQLLASFDLFARAITVWLGKPEDDYETRVLMGAMVGAMIPAFEEIVRNPNADFYELMDRAWAQLDGMLVKSL